MRGAETGRRAATPPPGPAIAVSRRTGRQQRGAADALGFGGLIWVAAAGGALWVLLIAIVVGSATGAALAVVLAGAGLLALGVLVARLRRTPPPGSSQA